jgi:hypothetical protein
VNGMNEIIVIHDKPIPAQSYRLNRTSVVQGLQNIDRLASFGHDSKHTLKFPLLQLLKLAMPHCM